MPFGRKSPLEALALPGVILAYKYSQFRQRRREAASRRVTERELSALHHKIDKLLNKLEESEPEPPTSQEDECVICINARATMQTSPCGHRVVCRRCFVKTIQSAVAQRLLPLRCVICRARVNRLTSSSGSWRIQESASSYSVGGKSWSSSSTCNGINGKVPQSASSYSMGTEPLSGHHTNNQQQQNQQQQQQHKKQQLLLHHHNNQNHNHNHHGNNGITVRNHVAQSASLYSMQSGTSSLSNSSNATSYSNTSSASSGIEMSSSASSILSSSGGNSSSTASSMSSFNSLNNRSQQQSQHHHHHHHNHNHHNNHSTCPAGCLGAIPRKPSLTSMSSGTTNTYPGRRYTKGRIADLQQNRLPPIKEFRSPIHHQKVPHTSPVHLSNPRFRYSSYTKSPSTHEMIPLLKDPSPTRLATSQKQQNLGSNTLTSIKQTSKLGLTSKVNPIASKIPIQKNGLTSPQNIKNLNNKKAELNHPSSSKSYSFSNNKNLSGSTSGSGSNFNSNGNKISNNKCNNSNTNGGCLKTSSSLSSPSSVLQNSNSRNFHQDEKADNKKNETMEKKKKDEKLKLKAEKEARKEEKRLAKEEERISKLLAKEEKKKGKREAKELLLAHDGNNKK